MKQIKYSNGKWWVNGSDSTVRKTTWRMRKNKQWKGPYIIRTQRHSSPAAGAELGLAVGTQMPTAICKLGFTTDATGRCIIFMDSLLSFRFCSNLLHLLLITLKLLVQCPDIQKIRWGERERGKRGVFESLNALLKKQPALLFVNYK